MPYANNKGADQPAHPRFMSYLVQNPEDRFSRDVAHMIMNYYTNMVLSAGEHDAICTRKFDID